MSFARTEGGAGDRIPFLDGLRAIGIGLVLFGHAAGMLNDQPRLNFVIGMTVMNVGSALCVDWCLTHGAGRIGALLSSRPLAFVGVLSYSLYLWQQIFLDPGASAMRLPWLQSVALLSVAALASYFLIERPFLRLRERLEPALFPRARHALPTADAVSATVASTP